MSFSRLAILFWLLVYKSARSQSIPKNDAIIHAEILQDLSSLYQLSCLRFLSESQEASFMTQPVFDLTKTMVTPDSVHTDFITVVRLTFSDFAKQVRRTYDFDNCFNSLQVFYAANGTASHFADICRYSDALVSKFYWLVFLPLGVSAEDFFADTPLPFDTCLMAVVHPGNSSQVWRFQEVFRLNHTSPVKSVGIGQWSAAKGLGIARSSMYRRRGPLTGLPMRIGYIQNYPLSAMILNPLTGETELAGLFPEVWKELEETLHFQTTAFSSVDNTTGICKTWLECNGLVGMLVRREIDAIVSELNVNQERKRIIDFSQPLLKTRYQVYFKLPGYNLSWLAVLKPFHIKLWVALLGWLFLAGGIMTVCYLKASEPPSDLSLQPNLTLFFILQSLCHQGYDQVPSSWSCRLIFVIAYLMGAIILPSYSASLISSLTSQVPTRPFDSLQGMIDYKSYKLLLAKNTAEHALFSQATDKLYSGAFKLLVETYESQLSSVPDLANQLCHSTHHYAQFRVESTMDYMVRQVHKSVKNCTIIKFKEPLSAVYQSIGFHKGNPYRDYIDHMLLEMLRAGIIRRVQARIWPLKEDRQHTNFKQVALEDVVQIFTLLLLGIALSMVVLLLEILFYVRKPAKTQKPRSRWLGTARDFYL